MRLFTEVSYQILDNNELYIADTIGLMHNREITNSTIKIFLKRRLVKDKKGFKIDIVNKQMMSEEDAFRQYGKKLITVSK